MSDSSKTDSTTPANVPSPLDRWSGCFAPELAHLRPSCWIVFNYICWRQQSWASIETMAKELPLGERAIRQALSWLQDNNWIVCTFKSHGGRMRTSRYTPTYLYSAQNAGYLPEPDSYSAQSAKLTVHKTPETRHLTTLNSAQSADEQVLTGNNSLYITGASPTTVEQAIKKTTDIYTGSRESRKAKHRIEADTERERQSQSKAIQAKD